MGRTGALAEGGLSRIGGTLTAMRLLVRNLDRSTTEADLRAVFEAYGRVQSCSIVLDRETGGSKGFAFVEMPKPGEAKAAVRNSNGMELDGARIRVKNAQPKVANVEASPEIETPSVEPPQEQ